MDEKENVTESNQSVNSATKKNIKLVSLLVLVIVVLVGFLVAIITVSLAGRRQPTVTTPEETTTVPLPDFYLTPTEELEIQESNEGMAFTIYVLPGTESIDLTTLVTAKGSWVVTDSDNELLENGILPITKDGESFVVIYGLNTVYRITVKYFSYHTVSFEGLEESQSVKSGGKATAPTQTPTKVGYIFDGWDFDFSKSVTADTAVSAKWTPKTYTVTLNPNGGTVETTKLTVTYGSTVEFPIPTKQGYNFAGWYDEDTYIPSGIWTFDSDKTLFAIWDTFDYRITYNANGGSVDKAFQGISYGESFLAPVPKRNGYSFCGWYCDGKLVESNVFTYSKDVEFVAKWAENTYNVHFVTNGGEAIPDATVLYSVIASTVPVREGYTFGGWFFNESLDKTEVTVGSNNTVTAYAWWTEESKTSDFTFNSNENGVIITGYLSDKSVCVIPAYIGGKNVVAIGESAFAGVTTLTRLMMPETVREIGKEAFADCSSLKKIDPIENTAKDFDVDLTGITAVGAGAFRGCGFASINIPTTVTALSDDLFKNCAALVTLSDISHITSVGGGVFSGCTSLSAITLPSGITSLGDDFFRNCVSLKNLELPKSVTSLGNGVFAGCSSLTSVTLPVSIKVIGSSLFDSCTALVTVENLANNGNIISIGERAFADCQKLTGLAIPSSVKTIGKEAFLNCLEIKTLTLPSAVTKIEDGTFMGCAYLQTLTVSGSITSIGDNAFNGCRRLRELTLNQALTSVGESAFENCINLKTVTLTNTLEELGNYAFRGCYSLTSVTISNKIKEIPEGAFEECTALSDLTWHTGIVKVGKRAFYNCRALALSAMPMYLETVESEAFKGCSGIQSISFESRLYLIEDFAFADCTSLTEVFFRGSGERWKAITDENAFAGCSDLNSIRVTAGIVEDLASSLSVNYTTQALFAIDSTLDMNGNRPAAVLRFKAGSLFYRNFVTVDAEGVSSVNHDYVWKLSLDGETTDEFTFSMTVTVSLFDLYHMDDGGYIFLDLGERFSMMTDLAKVTASLEIASVDAPDVVLYTASLGSFLFEGEKDSVTVDSNRTETEVLTDITVLSGPDMGAENGVEKLFDGDCKDKFFSNDRTPITVKLSSPIVLASYSLVTSSTQYCYPFAAPMGWTLYGGVTGEDGTVEWVELSRVSSSRMDAEGMTEYNFKVSTTEAYSLYKLEFDGTHLITMGEIQFYPKAS